MNRSRCLHIIFTAYQTRHDCPMRAISRLSIRPFPAVVGMMVVLSFSLDVALAQPFSFFQVRDHNQALRNLSFATVHWADVDGDGRLDVPMAGNDFFASLPSPYLGMVLFSSSRHVPTDQGKDRLEVDFTQAPSFPAPDGLWLSTMAWGDYDSDGDPDLLVGGATAIEMPYQPAITLYRNDGGGSFAPVSTQLPAIYGGAFAWGDYDNDGRQDLLLSGFLDEHTYTTQLFRNTPEGFVLVDAGLPDVAASAVVWGDYDGDDDLDLAITGVSQDEGFLTRIYRNDGDGTFTDIHANLLPVAFGALEWADVDSDGDLDLTVSGGRWSPLILDGHTTIYLQSASNHSFVPNDHLPDAAFGSVRWGDYDADGDLDVLVMGSNNALEPGFAQVYQNQGFPTFAPVANLPGVFPGMADWGDLDGDGDLDILVTGNAGDNRALLALYENARFVENRLPVAPAGLNASVSGRTVTLQWDAGSDVETPQRTLTYNLRVGTTPGGVDVVSPLAASDGRRFVAGMGNVELGTHHTLKNLAPGSYYWSVQTVDNTFTGSAFAGEATFTIGSSAGDGVGTGAEDPSDLPRTFALHAVYPNPFRDVATVSYDLPEQANVEVAVYNVLGSRVYTLAQGQAAAGRYAVAWDGRDGSGQRLAAGLYFVRLRAGEHVQTAKVLLVR